MSLNTALVYRLTFLVLCVFGLAACLAAMQHGGLPLLAAALGVFATAVIAFTSGLPAARRHYLWPLMRAAPAQAEQSLNARMGPILCLLCMATLAAPGLLDYSQWAPRGTAHLGVLVYMAVSFPMLSGYLMRLAEIRQREQEQPAGTTSDAHRESRAGAAKSFLASVPGYWLHMLPGILIGVIFSTLILDMTGTLKRTQLCSVVNVGSEAVEVEGMNLAPGQTALFFAPDGATIDVNGAPIATFNLKGRTAEVEKEARGPIAFRFTDQ